MIDIEGCLYALTFPNGKQYIGITSGTEESRARMSAAQKGRTFSEETRLKMSIAAKNRKSKNG